MVPHPRKRVFSACAVALVATGLSAGGASAAPRSAPALATPRDQVAVQTVPAFEWKRVPHAEKYEFQLAADSHFESMVWGQGRGSFQTRNTFATIDETLPNGSYYWRVRAINAKEDAGRWSRTRSIRKAWDVAPELVEPVHGETIAYPQTPLILRWNPVPRAYKYLLWIGTDPSLASVDTPIETSGTVYSPHEALGPGRYFWAVTPIDAQKHLGTRSGVGSFQWTWPSRSTVNMFDLNADARVLDPQFAWDGIPGASRYEVEINPSADFAVGSRVCCDEKVIGTSLSAKHVLPNNGYYWRVRAVDLDGQAGVWNYGAPFAKGFDDVVPSIPNLHMRDNVTDAPVDSDPISPELDTSYPIVRWDPVPGASSYQVEVVPYEGAFCNWTARPAEHWNANTATTAWTPLAAVWNRQKPGVNIQSVSYDGGTGLDPNRTYCVRVQARTDRDSKQNPVVSEWTQLGGVNNPAFRWVPAAAGSGVEPGALGLTMPNAEAYLEPQTGTVSTRMPLFTWRPINGAGSYFVVVAKDPAFTQVTDVALTNLPMYAPRKWTTAQTYPDETTSYYWAVIPASGSDGSGASSQAGQNYPRSFDKRSIPPTLLEPHTGDDVASQPVFRWSSTEGARDYDIQVATDASFSNLVDDVRTAATSYTSETTYPADTVLYWRVRAADENGVGLTWSDTSTFRRRLPVPHLFADNPLGGEVIPVLRWEPVAGASSYDLHLDQSDGTRKDFHLRGTAATFIGWYGTGVWHWQVRANFPSGSWQEVQGGYTPSQPFTRRIATPSHLRAVNRDRKMLLSWDPAAMAKNYRVDISTTDSFTRIVDTTITDHTEWAPDLTQPDSITGGKFYWRVATMDEGRNVGGFRVSHLRTKRGFLIAPRGFPRKGAASLVGVQVQDGRQHRIRHARVVVTGAGVGRRARRTNRDGIATFNVRPRKRGVLRFKISKRGFRSGSTTIAVA
jgi:hypothetical protein